MKVLHVGKYYHPFRGGIETVVRQLARGFTQVGHEATVLCFSDGGGYVDEVIEGVRVVRCPRHAHLLSAPISVGFGRELRRLANEHQLVHLHSPNPLAELAAISLPKDKRLVVTYHSDVIRQRALMPFYGPMIKRCLQRASAIVVPTEAHIHNSPILPSFRARCEIIPFGIEEPAHYQGEPRVARLCQDTGPFILFVGRMVHYKGLIHLIRAMPRIHASLVIAGDGPLQRAIEAESDRLGLHGRVRFMGSVDEPMLRGLLATCEMLVLPSITRAEAYGMVMLEAMAYGKPVVSTRLPSGASFVNADGVTGYQVAPGNSDELALAVHRILANPRLKAEMSKAARRRYEELFTARRMVDAHVDLYARLLGSWIRKNARSSSDQALGSGPY